MSSANTPKEHLIPFPWLDEATQCSEGFICGGPVASCYKFEQYQLCIVFHIPLFSHPIIIIIVTTTTNNNNDSVCYYHY